MQGFDDEWLAKRFQEQRPRLKSVAQRMLGSSAEAEDAVQEAWLRLSRADSSSIDNLGAWLTTVVARVSLDQLRRRKVRGEEEQLDEEALVPAALENAVEPDHELLLAESVEQAMILVLDRLAPAERVAYVLHDLFDLPFGDIASILERSEESARQLASRARRRVRIARESGQVHNRNNRQVVEAFLAASRLGDFSALLRLLDPQVVLKADAIAVQIAASNRAKGAPLFEPEVKGPEHVAKAFSGRARGARLAMVAGEVGAVWFDEVVRAVFIYKVKTGLVQEIEIVMEPGRLQAMSISLLE